MRLPSLQLWLLPPVSHKMIPPCPPRVPPLAGLFVFCYTANAAFNMVVYAQHGNCDKRYKKWFVAQLVMALALNVLAVVEMLSAVMWERHHTARAAAPVAHSIAPDPGYDVEVHAVRAAVSAKSAAKGWCHQSVGTAPDPIWGMMYALVVLVSVAGALVFFAASPTDGDCETLRQVGVWSVLVVTAFAGVAGAVFIVRWAMNRRPSQQNIRKLETTAREVLPMHKGIVTEVPGDGGGGAGRSVGVVAGVDTGAGAHAGANAGADVGVDAGPNKHKGAAAELNLDLDLDLEQVLALALALALELELELKPDLEPDLEPESEPEPEPEPRRALLLTLTL